jgi:predicted DCC family thiol-disulfide oxidoreductase YuxK
MISDDDKEGPIILFDGVCNLCNRSIQFVIKHDKNHVFRFASLQGEFGKKVVKNFHLTQQNYDSFLLLQKGKIYQKSTGALMVAKQFSGAWKMVYLLIVVPSFIRNAIYSLISNNRYRWFGKKQVCWLPKPEDKKRFLN